MDKDVVEILENQKLFNWYFDNRNYILLLVSLCLVVAWVYMSRKILLEIGIINYGEIFLKYLGYIVIAVIVGTEINAAGMEVEFAINHMPILLFSGVIFIIVGIQILECIRYSKNFEEVIKKTNMIFIGIVQCVVLLLAIMGRLEIIELVVAVIGCITLKTLTVYIDSCIRRHCDAERNNETMTEDCPISIEEDLFGTRKRQLYSLCDELNRCCRGFGEEPFAVAISGKWGSGKTSFVNVLKRKLNRAEVVNIECGIEYNAKAVLQDISVQIKEIYKMNNVYTEQNGVIDKYFKKIGEFVAVTGNGHVTKIFDNFWVKENSSYWESKDEMNKEVKRFYELTKKHIYFVVDDIDRIIENKTKSVLFQVLRECVNLNHCITLFITDYERLTSEYISKEFLEKYVNRRFELCEPEFDEIVEKYEELYFADSFWEGKSAYIVEHGSACVEDIKNNAVKFLSNIQNKIEELECLNGAKTSDHDIKINEESIGYLKDAKIRIQRRIRNPRKVKRYLAALRNMITTADTIWFQNESASNNEYSQENWIEIIMEVAFLKTFLYEEYDELINAGSLELFRQNRKSSTIVEIIISGFFSLNTYDDRKESVVRMVVYRLYALDININKTEHQKLREEIDTNNLRENNLVLYINECMGINFHQNRMKKILDYLENHIFKELKYKSEAVVSIIDAISKTYDIFVPGLSDIMKRIKIIVDDSRSSGALSLEECRMIERYKETLQTRLIFENNSTIRSILEVLYNTELEEYFCDNLGTISKLYNTIKKISDKYLLPGFAVCDSELEALINYFQGLEEMANKEEFRYAREEIIYFVRTIMDMLEILDIWFGKEAQAIPEQYYDSIRGKFNQKVWENPDNLIRGLKELESYAIAHKEDINPGSAFIQLLFDVEKMGKKSLDYFGEEDKNKAIIVISEVYEQLGKNQIILQAFGEDWLFCKIRLFRLRRNMKI